jgi:hypothetical protein
VAHQKHVGVWRLGQSAATPVQPTVQPLKRNSRGSAVKVRSGSSLRSSA